MLMDCRRLVRACDVFPLGTAIQNLSSIKLSKACIYVKKKLDIFCVCVKRHPKTRGFTIAPKGHILTDFIFLA